MIANNPRLAAVGSEANRQRARDAARAQAMLARVALEALSAQRASAHRDRWITALQHRISNPDATLAELGHTMTPAMTKHAYAALLRRALQGGGIAAENGPDGSEGRRRG